MEIPVLAKTMELDNLYHIYLFYFKKDDCSHRVSVPRVPENADFL